MSLPKKQSDFTMGLFLIKRPGAEVIVVEVKPAHIPAGPDFTRPCEPPAGATPTDWHNQIFREFGLLRDES